MGPHPLRGANSSLWTLEERKSLSFAMYPPVSGGSVDLIMIQLQIHAHGSSPG